MRRVDYEQRMRIDGIWCVYCGELRQVDEHFPPLVNSAWGYILPACSECNSLAGAAWPRDFAKRADYVKKAIERRYRKALRTPYWSPDDIGDLGYTLSTGIKLWQHKRKYALRRIAWNAESYIRSIDGGSVFVPRLADRRIFTMSVLKSWED